MKYMIIGELKKPQKENYAKAMEIEKKRMEKGLSNKMNEVTPMFIVVGTSLKSYWVVDCDIEDVTKWAIDYSEILDAKIVPVLTREEWSKI